ncbi:hypothetical protein ABKV19_013217 [Rosa sericea]
MQMKNGVELVRKCSKFNEWTSNETYKYTSQLFELDEYLQRQLSVLILQVASDVKETSVMLKNVRKVVERIEGISGVAKNQQLALDVVEVDETRDVRETTLVSASNVEAELTLVDGEDDEIPEPPSFTVGLEDPPEELMRMSGQKPRKKENSKMKLLKDGVAMLDPTGPYKRMRARAMARERNPIMLGALREFSYRELKEATNNFDFKHMISRGECVVYRGLLSKDNLEVAVKKYSRAESEGKDDFGLCHKDGLLFTVHEYMPNGSLDNHLYSALENATLGWSQRYKIISGVASILHYLHNEFGRKVVHRHITASNIMLDSHFNARLGNYFSLRSASYSELERFTGTMGYIAPESFDTGKVTCEFDVYGFGAVVLEVVCGQRPWNETEGFQHFVDWVWSLHGKGRVLEAVDGRLGNEYDVEEAQRLLLLGLACSHPIAHERPNSQTIVQVISGSIPAPKVSLFKPDFKWQDMQEEPAALSIHTANT